MALGNKIIWLFIAAAIEAVSFFVYAFDSQTLMITSILVVIIVLKVAFSLIQEKKMLEGYKKRNVDLMVGEIKWLKAHKEKLNYKHPEKLKEYVGNRIEYLQEQQNE